MIEDLVRNQRVKLDKQLNILLASPKRSFTGLKDSDVPPRKGLYLIYDDRTAPPVYIGIAKKTKINKSGKPPGLQFRIMQNHLGKKGTDNFLEYLAEELQGDKKLAVEYVRNHCSCVWLEMDNDKEITILEHYAIALLNPRFNR